MRAAASRGPRKSEDSDGAAEKAPGSQALPSSPSLPTPTQIWVCDSVGLCCAVSQGAPRSPHIHSPPGLLSLEWEDF